MNSTSNPSQALDKAHPAPLLLTEARDSGRILVNGSAQTPGNCEPPHSQKESTLTSYIILQTEEKPSPLSADGQNSDDALPSSIFGPKKKFKPVVQRPLPKDISLHSALMEAIHTSGGRDKLRKVNVVGVRVWVQGALGQVFQPCPRSQEKRLQRQSCKFAGFILTVYCLLLMHLNESTREAGGL